MEIKDENHSIMRVKCLQPPEDAVHISSNARDLLECLRKILISQMTPSINVDVDTPDEFLSQPTREPVTTLPGYENEGDTIDDSEFSPKSDVILLAPLYITQYIGKVFRDRVQSAYLYKDSLQKLPSEDASLSSTLQKQREFVEDEQKEENQNGETQQRKRQKRRRWRAKRRKGRNNLKQQKSTLLRY